MSADAAAALAALADGFRTRDVDAVLAGFADDAGVTYAGSEAGEVAVGREQLRSLLCALFARDVAYGWDVVEMRSQRQGVIEIVLAELVGHEYGPSAVEDFPYRISGVLRHDGHGGAAWLLIHAAEPAASRSF